MRATRFHGAVSFNTRSYADGGGPGPTLRARRGDKVLIALENRLDFPTQAAVSWTGLQEQFSIMAAQCEPYSSPNVTSLHFHGLTISTGQAADNPYRTCSPQETIQYEFHILEDHPSGTFWYHPHADESNSLQTAGLMGGMFVVEDVDAHADTDVEATMSYIRNFDDDVLLFQWQSLQSSFLNMDFLSRCAHSAMPVEQVAFENATGNDFINVNGVYKPAKRMVAGVFQRWRLANGCMHRYVGMSIPDTCEAYAIAADGVYYDQPRSMSYVLVTLGSRIDLLVRCSESSEFWSEKVPWETDDEATTIWGDDPGFYEHLLLTADVSAAAAGDATVEASDAFAALCASGSAKLDSGYFDEDVEAASDDAATHDVVLSEYENAVTEWYTINDSVFTGRISRRVRLGQKQVWTIRHAPITWVGTTKNHNWHLHAYHFKVMKVVDADGVEYTESPAGDWKAGDVRDTVSVPVEGYAVVEFVPVKYTGLVLHHCHIFNHETGGLKAMFAVVDCRDDTVAALKTALCESPDRWAFTHLDDLETCIATIDYYCSDSAMAMTYDEAYWKLLEGDDMLSTQ